MNSEYAEKGIIEVGDGRGFIVEDQCSGVRYVITAAHCLPELPPYGPYQGEGHRYGDLLRAIGGSRQASADCCFADPIGDIAVLCSPDPGEDYESAKEYAALVGACAFEATDIPEETFEDMRVRMLSLDGRWVECLAQSSFYGQIWTSTPTFPGMSGSPILTTDWKAVGIVASGGEELGNGPHVRLGSSLTHRLFRRLVG